MYSLTIRRPFSPKKLQWIGLMAILTNIANYLAHNGEETHKWIAGRHRSKTMWNSEPAFISSMIDTVVWIIWRVGSVSMTLRFWHLQRAYGRGFYVEGVMPVWKESLEGVGLNCPELTGNLSKQVSDEHYCRFLYEYCQMSLTGTSDKM